MTEAFREMRRHGQQLTDRECEEILCAATSGVMSLVGDGGYPYGVPLSHAYSQGKLYFHCALTGHKTDAIRHCPKASFTVIDADRIDEEHFTTRYRSVIAFGQVSIITDDEQKAAAARLITRHLCPHQTAEATGDEIAAALHRMCVLEMKIEHMTGKRGRNVQ